MCSLRCEEEASCDELIGLGLHCVEVVCEALTGSDGAVVCACRIEAIERRPDGKYIVHDRVNSERLSLLDLYRHARCISRDT